MADLVFIHGAGESGEVWQKQLAYFSPAHRVQAVDLPGHGARRDELALDNHERNADDVLHTIDKLGWEKPVLVGYSMGGAIALLIALQHPARISGLVLVATGARLRMHPDFLERARKQAEDPQPPAAPPVSVEEMVAPSTSPTIRDWLRPRAMNAPPQAIYADFLANNSFDAMGQLGGIAVPTLVIGGSDDRMAPPKFSQYLAEHIAGAQLVIFPNCGHYPQAEQEELFNKAVDEFLARLRDPG
ncbi:MAG: alpha/beta hydrolase [Deltaproteobacteria bacterium]|nr:alpha/beta hydrolase [Deltaproteobacteria bacterium]